MKNHDVLKSNLDALFKVWGSKFTQLTASQQNGIAENGNTVNPNMIAAGEFIFSKNLTPEAVASSGYEVKRFNDIFGKVTAAKVKVSSKLAGSSSAVPAVNPIQLAALNHNPSLSARQNILTQIEHNQNFVPTPVSDANETESLRNSLVAGTPAKALDDVTDKASAIAKNMLSASPTPGGQTVTNSGTVTEATTGVALSPLQQAQANLDKVRARAMQDSRGNSQQGFGNVENGSALSRDDAIKVAQDAVVDQARLQLSSQLNDNGSPKFGANNQDLHDLISLIDNNGMPVQHNKGSYGLLGTSADQMQKDKINNGTWKPSDGFYFSTQNGMMFDPTGKMADNQITNPEKYTNGPDGLMRKPETVIGGPEWLKANGYSYNQPGGSNAYVSGPKGDYNTQWEIDPAKKGDYQKMLETKWANAKATPVDGATGWRIDNLPPSPISIHDALARHTTLLDEGYSKGILPGATSKQLSSDGNWYSKVEGAAVTNEDTSNTMPTQTNVDSDHFNRGNKSSSKMSDSSSANQAINGGTAIVTPSIPKKTDLEVLAEQNNRVQNNTWKPSDGFYFSTQNGLMFDPTGKTADNQITNPEKYTFGLGPDGVQRKPETVVDGPQWLKANGYDYNEPGGSNALIKGPKGPHSIQWETDPAKKGVGQKEQEALWASVGAYPAGSLPGSTFGGNAADAAQVQRLTAITSDPFKNPNNAPNLVNSSWVKPSGINDNQALSQYNQLLDANGQPKPGVTPDMLSKAWVNVAVTGTFDKSGHAAGLVVDNGMVFKDNVNWHRPADALPSPDHLKALGYTPGLFIAPDPNKLGVSWNKELGADGQMWTLIPASTAIIKDSTIPSTPTNFASATNLATAVPAPNSNLASSMATRSSTTASPTDALKAEMSRLQGWNGPGYDGLGGRNAEFPDVTTDAQYQAKVKEIESQLSRSHNGGYSASTDPSPYTVPTLPAYTPPRI